MKFIKNILCKLAKVVVTEEHYEKCCLYGKVIDDAKQCPYKVEVESDE